MINQQLMNPILPIISYESTESTRIIRSRGLSLLAPSAEGNDDGHCFRLTAPPVVGGPVASGGEVVHGDWVDNDG